MTPPPKIIHFHPNGRFATIFVDPLMEAERAHGYVSTMVTSVNLPASGGTVIPYDLSLRNLPGLLFSFMRIIFFLKAQKPSVVISHNAKSSSLPLFAAWLMGVRSRIYYNHGVPFIAYRGILMYLLKWLESINCTLATSIVTVSQDMCNVLLGLKPNAKISLIGHGSACGLDLNIYNALRYRESSFRISHGIAKDDLAVVFVGRPERRKGFDLAVQMWSDHFKDHGYKLILCGPETSDVLKVLPEIPSNIICLGFAKNIPEILSNCECLLLPSMHEGLSYAILEAMACGCVVVANDIEGVRNLVHDGENGYLISDNAVSKYVTFFRSIGNRALEMASIRRSAIETGRIYSRELFLPAYLAFVENVLADAKQ
jgi:N,N'-diacetylbacillosaminyl-diphospho-undecaprenol alpha-1,3-N-acetylgalactosaminyltransferase